MAIGQYFNTLGHDYAWDDAIVIRDNVYTQDGLGSLKDIWTKPVYIPQREIYRPIPQTTFALENYFSPNGNPMVGHFVNMLFYALCCFLIFHFFKLLIPQYHLIFAFLASLLFLVHPVHTEVVANIKSRDEIIALSFGLASMIFFIRYLSDKKIMLISTSILFFIMACLSKLNAITLLAIYPIIYYFNTQVKSTKLGSYHLFSKNNSKTDDDISFDFPLIHKAIIAFVILSFLAIAIYLKNELILLAYTFVISALLIAYLKRIKPWDFIFLISTLILTSYYFNFPLSTEALLVLFFIYCYENKNWEIKYLIPIGLLIAPRLFVSPQSIIYLSIIFIALKKNNAKLFYLMLISASIYTFVNIYNSNYLDIITIIFSLTYAIINYFKGNFKILPILSILLFLGLFSYELTKNSATDFDLKKVTNIDNEVKSLELSVINNSLINEPNSTRYPTIAKIQLEYLKKMFYPHPLIHNYGYNVIENITWKNPVPWFLLSYIFYYSFLF